LYKEVLGYDLNMMH